MLNQAQKNFLDQHTFQPQINKEYPTKTDFISKEERLKALTEPKTEKIL